jgi:hypothetical protein
MTRLLFENSRRPGRGGDNGAGAEEDALSGRASSAIDEDAGRARVRRPREDPSGRRSLTGLEFRRQRSI